MSEQTCPYCGAERHIKYDGIYECGTDNYYSPFDIRSRLCHYREAHPNASRSYEERIVAYGRNQKMHFLGAALETKEVNHDQ